MNVNKDTIADSTGGSNYIGKSGVYDVVINFASLATSKNGATSVNFNVDYNGNTQTLWGPYIEDTQGNTLDIGMGLLIKLGVIAGLEDGDDFDIEEETHNVGKDNTPTDFDVITNFSEMPCKVHVQEEYSRYRGEIRSGLVIKAFFSEDGASAEEITNDKEPGKQLALIQEKGWDTKVTYRDSVKGAGDAPTPKEVEEWKEAKRNDKANTKSTTGTVAKSATTGRRFGRK